MSNENILSLFESYTVKTAEIIQADSVGAGSSQQPMPINSAVAMGQPASRVGTVPPVDNAPVSLPKINTSNKGFKPAK